VRLTITGTTGTLGKALVRHAEAAGHTLLHLNRPQHDITNPDAITSAITTFKPDIVIHPAAYTNVDGAESEQDIAFAVNAQGTRNVAIACEAAGSPLIYISTNMVFDGTKGTPYVESDPPNPRGVYATSKWEGEMHVKEVLTRHYIARVSWLYGRDGDSFIHKIIRAADKHGKLSVVANEVATPTYAEDLAEALLKLATTGRYGIYHLINEGECSRYEYAAEIMRLTNRAHIPITPTALSDFKRPAYTPPHSTLLNTRAKAISIRLRPWQEALESYLKYGGKVIEDRD
jgi:dTDP-4-dehydrorhamnose reductase